MAQSRACMRDRSGGTIIWFALTMPIILGMTGLGVDATLWYMDKRILQTASDSGAIAGAHVLEQGGTETEARQTVEKEVGRNDFAAKAGDVITVNIPPLSGPNAGTAGFIEVIITKQRPLYFARFFRDQSTFIQSRAVSGARSIGQHCVLALDEDMDAALEFTGTANADIDCGVASNSRSNSAIDIQGKAVLTASPTQAHGDISISGSANLVTDLPMQPYSARVANPYEDLEVPDLSPCDETSQVQLTGGSTTLNPGRYCGGIRLNGADVTFNPGVYIIDAGDFIVNSTSAMQGDGVTFILTADDPNDIGNLKINGNAEADLIAPSDEGNPYVGVLFYQDSRAPSFQGAQLIKNDILGGTATNLQGAIYFPSQEVRFSGGSNTDAGCLQLIGRKVTFSGIGNIVNDEEACEDLRVRKIEMLRVALIE